MPEFALEILTNIGDNFPKPLVEYWGKDVVLSPLLWFEKAQEKALSLGADYVSVYFNVDDNLDNIQSHVELFSNILKAAKLPLIVRGSANKSFDGEFLPALVGALDASIFSLSKRPVIFAFAQDLNYKPIVHSILKSKFANSIRLVLRAPIDINLTKELNVLTADLGFNPDNIIMDTDTGCVGMGLDYGYSIIERLVLARNEGDTVLNPPIIVFSGEESFKLKESKSDDFKDTRGSLKTRSCAVEVATTTALITAGADIAVCWNPLTLETLIPLYSTAFKTLEGGANG